MKKTTPSKLKLSRITVAKEGVTGGWYYNTYGTGCGISYANWCSNSCNSCAGNCGTAQYSACNGLHCI